METEDIKYLIKSAKNGNNNAFSGLVEIYLEKIFRLCLKLTKNGIEAEDLVQDVFFKAFRKIKKYDGKSEFSTWIYRIAVNMWIDRVRRNKIIEFFSISTIMKDKNDINMERELKDVLPGPEKKSEDDEIKENLDKGLKELPEDQRMVVILRIYENKSYEEIAKICKCSVGTVGSRLSRALINLREHIKQ